MIAFKSDLKDAADELKNHQAAIKRLETQIEQLKGGIYALGLLIPKKKETSNG